ncbi:DUF3253 domain-containing protein [Streptomyces sp. NPDC048182]|uniref:DUF3253 domain-containing protein n=1 Tax=unclassified Streptomyces TaxID=2593676 RepID=UPI0033A1F5E4
MDALARVVLGLLDERAPTSSICPSDVARAAYDGDDEGWRELMEPVREAVRGLADAGEVEVTQRGRVVDPREAKGPVRIRRPR